MTWRPLAFIVLATAACTNTSAPVTACVPTPGCAGSDAGLLECTTFSVNAECLDFFYVSANKTRIECGCVPDVTTCNAKVTSYCSAEAGLDAD
jgi:hypothetical protein